MIQNLLHICTLWTDETQFTRDDVFNIRNTQMCVLTPLDFYLWAHLKEKLYSQDIDNLNELQRISHASKF